MKSKAEVELTKCQAADAIKWLLLLLLLLSPAFKQLVVVVVLRLQLQLQLTCGSPRQLAAFKTSHFFFLLLLKFVIPLSCCYSSSLFFSSCFSCGFFLPIAFIKLRPAFNLRSLRSPSVIKFCAKHLPFFLCAFFFSLLFSSPSPSASFCCSCHSFKWSVSILVARVLLYIYVFHGTPFQEPVNAANICRLHYDAKQGDGKGTGGVETCRGLWSLTLCIPAAIDSKAFMQISPKLDSRNSCCSSQYSFFIPSGKKGQKYLFSPF